MPVRTIADALHHLKELADLEKMFDKQFDIEGFEKALMQFVITNFDINTNHPPTPADILMIDDFVERWLKHRVADAERWIVRAYIVGKFLEESEKIAKRFLLDVNKLPTDINMAAANYQLNPVEVQALTWAKLHGGEHIKNTTQATAAIVRRNLMIAIEKGGGYGYFQRMMERETLKEDGDINRMWRRVAITEVNSAFNNGYLLQLDDRSWVVGYSLPDACDSCKAVINGKVYLYIQDAPTIDYGRLGKNTIDYKKSTWQWENCVWAGKNNVGRSFSEYKRARTDRVDDVPKFIKREHEELSMPAIPAHIHCRCRWLEINPATMWISSDKKLRIKHEDPVVWENWHKRVIAPIIETWYKFTKEKLQG